MCLLLQEGKRGYLEGLAAHYSKQINMPYEDVLDAIEEVRVSKWKERHVRISTGHTLSRRAAGSSSSGGGGMGVSVMSGMMGGGGGVGVGFGIIGGNIANQSTLPTSHSQPLYVPGKYLVRIRRVCHCSIPNVAQIYFFSTFLLHALYQMMLLIYFLWVFVASFFSSNTFSGLCLADCSHRVAFPIVRRMKSTALRKTIWQIAWPEVQLIRNRRLI